MMLTVTEMKEFMSQVVKKFNSFDDPRVNWEFLKYKRPKRQLTLRPSSKKKK